MQPIRLYRDFSRLFPLRTRTGRTLKRAAAYARGTLGARHQANWLQFLFYHYVFDDQRRGFERQLRYLKSVADVIPVDDALALIRDGKVVNGRYVCLSFDDGFASCFENAFPLLDEHGVSATFFLPTGFVGLRLNADGDRMKGFFSRRFTSALVEFMDWEQCRKLQQAGMTIGSHSIGHVPLSRLDETSALEELMSSRRRIEAEIGVPCVHFSAPIGKIGRDIKPERDYALARRAGYASIHTTSRIESYVEDGIVVVGRKHAQAHWTVAELRSLLESTNNHL